MEIFTFSQVNSEIDKLINKYSISDQTIEVGFEKSELIIKLFPAEITFDTINEALVLAKKHLENWRIHTFEKKFLSIQALNSNLFDTNGILNNLRIRISALYDEKMIEISKKEVINSMELNLIFSFIKTFCSVEKKSIEHLLAEAGCHVYLPSSQKEDGFAQFAGYDSIKNHVLETVILPVKNPEVYDKITQVTREKFESIRPRAILFSGPPGVGKTTMAKILAHETGFLLVYIPVESIMSAFYGESTRKLAYIFDVAASFAERGIILFLDEIDALAMSRDGNMFEATRRILSVLLRKIDGMEAKSNYITIGATNRKTDLDEALLSRFDTILEFSLPNKQDIEKILELYARHLRKEDQSLLADKLTGYSPRTIKDICKRAERIQARKNIQSGSNGLPEISTYLQSFSEARINNE